MAKKQDNTILLLIGAAVVMTFVMSSSTDSDGSPKPAPVPPGSNQNPKKLPNGIYDGILLGTTTTVTYKEKQYTFGPSKVAFPAATPVKVYVSGNNVDVELV